jgi:hypothetical protein
LQDLRNTLNSLVFESPCSTTNLQYTQTKTAVSGYILALSTWPIGEDFLLSLTQ